MSGSTFGSERLEYMHMDPKRGRELHDYLDPQLLRSPRTAVAEAAAERRKLIDVDASTLEGLDRKRSIVQKRRQRGPPVR